MMKTALKITHIIISFIVSSILTFIEGIILKKIIIPSKIEPNKELITVETITNLRNQSMLLREEYDRYASSLSFGSRSKLLITIQKYDSAISKLITIRKRKEIIDSENIAKKSDKYEIGR